MRIWPIFFALFSLSVGAQIPALSPEAQDCNVELKVCRYFPEYYAPQILIQKINTVLNNEKAFRGQGMYLTQEMNTEKTLMYWVEGLNDRIAELLRLFDTPEHYRKNKIIEVRADIYQMAESSVTQIGLEISRIGLSGFTTDNTPKMEGFKFGATIGKLELGGVLAAERSKNKIKSDGKAQRTVFNNEDFSISQLKTKYFAPGAGTTVFPQYAGLSMGGKAAWDEVQNKVIMKNFTMNYGIERTDGYVEVLNFPETDILLEQNQAYQIVSMQSVGEVEYDTIGAFSFLHKRTKEATKLVIFLTATMHELDSYLEMIQGPKKKESLTADEVTALPKECPSEVDLLSDVKLQATRNLNGDPLLFIQLNQKNLCQSNLKEFLSVKTMGDGDNKSKSVKVENMALLPFNLDNIPMTMLAGEKDIEFRIKLKMEKSGTSVTHKVRFTPSKDDITDNFRFR